ncbi:Cytoplasmic FMR1-interacting protein 2, partial [Borealophlyctis nickersoniae]
MAQVQPPPQQPSLEDYLSQLSSIPCPIQSPQITAPSPSVSYSGQLGHLNLAHATIFDPEQYFDYKAWDKSAAGGIKYFVKESAHVAKLNDLLKEGRTLLAQLYSYRSCGRAIPQVQSQDQPNRTEIYSATYTVLSPLVNQMHSFMVFRDTAVATVTDVLTSLIPEIRDRDFFPSAAFLEAFARCLDMFVVFDGIKNGKGSMNNDFSMFKRALPNLPPTFSVQDDTAMHHKLYFFLAQQDQFATELKKSCTNLHSSYEDVVVDLLNLCADLVEGGVWVVPETKFMYLKAMAFGLYLLDGEGDDHDITRRKKLKVDRFGKIFKSHPIVPLFGDMPIALSVIYGKAPHLSATRWSEPGESSIEDTSLIRASASVARSYSLANHVDAARLEHAEYTAAFKRTVNVLRVSHRDNAAFSNAECATVYNIVLQGVKLLASLTTKVLEQSAWKFANPTSPSLNPSVPATAISYELAVRFNYSSEEKRALIEYIAMIKSLSSLLNDLDRTFVEGINRYIYTDIQTFVKHNLGDYMAHATKKKRPAATILRHIRDITLDAPFEDPDAPSSSPTKQSSGTVRGKDKSSPISPDPSLGTSTSTTATTGTGGPSGTRVSPISQLQLHLARALLDYCYNEKSKGMKGGLMREKDFKDAQVNDMREFWERSYYWTFMLDLKGTISKCSDLSDLWFKEFYLELSKQVQFPISMSLPWILTEYILDSNDPEIIGFVFYPFSLYNDAGNRTLHQLKCRYIYDEIVAEVNLCFDQLLFKLCQKIFLHFKKAASNNILAADLKMEMDIASQFHAAHAKDMPFDAYDAILKQKSYQLLGRSLDISELVSQMMNQYLRKSIDIAISRYEASEFTYIMELDTLLRSTRATHNLLSRFLNLDSFEDMLSEMDESISLGAVNGRIVTHTVQEFVVDFVPNFCYCGVTGRFVKAAVQYAEQPPRPNFPKAPVMYLYGTKALSVAFAAQTSMYKEFVGAPHFEALIRWVGEKGVPVIVAEITKHVEMIMKHTMTTYIRVIQKGTPQTLTLPLFEYGTQGNYDYFAAHLKPLIGYRDLKSEVLQAFREVGNIVLIVRRFEDVLGMGNTLGWLQTSAVIGARKDTRRPHFGLLSEIDPLVGSTSYPLPFSTWAPDSAAFHTPSATPHALLHPFLTQVRATLASVSGEWHADGLIENPSAFFRIWSALQFAFCVTGEEGSTRELFGDGLAWAG